MVREHSKRILVIPDGDSDRKHDVKSGAGDWVYLVEHDVVDEYGERAIAEAAARKRRRVREDAIYNREEREIRQRHDARHAEQQQREAHAEHSFGAQRPVDG